jgi:phosphoketolase
MKGISMTSAAFTDSIKFSATSRPLSKEELRKMNDYWRAANYLSVGQIYLYDNPLLREPLKLEHIKPRLLGHLISSVNISPISKFVSSMSLT